MFLNADVPHWYCLLRKEFLYNQTKGHGEYVPCAVFGVTSIESRAVMFVCMTENGAQIDRLPISAFCWKECERQEVEILEAWDCFSYDVSVTKFGYLRGLTCETVLKDGEWHPGSYMFTLDWAMSSYAEDSGEGGHKSGHVIKLECGNYAIQPNNRIFWREASFITKPFRKPERPDYLTNGHNWRSENGSKWVTEDTERQFYEYQGEENGSSFERCPHGFTMNGLPCYCLKCDRHFPIEVEERSMSAGR